MESTALISSNSVDADSQDVEYRNSPHNIEAEQALLGAILVNNEACDRVSSFLEPEHFYEPLHARIFEAAATLIRAGKLASPVTLKTYFDADAALAEIGGPVYLARLAAAATTVINASEYGRAVYELAQRRRLISIGEDVVNGSYDMSVGSSPRDLIEASRTGTVCTGGNRQVRQGFHQLRYRTDTRRRHGGKGL